MDKRVKKFDLFKENLSKQLKPKRSWWSLVGIVFFFFVPEVVAFFWGDKIISYSDLMQKQTDDYLMQKFFETLKMFGENSIFNIIIGIGLVLWFFHERNKT